MRIEKTEPSLTGARALLVIAAQDDPRRCCEERHCRLEEIGLPDIPPVAPWTPVASCNRCWARIFAIVIIADVNDEIRGKARCGGRDAGERPCCWIVARLPYAEGLVQPTTRVAQHDDPLGFDFRQR